MPRHERKAGDLGARNARDRGQPQNDVIDVRVNFASNDGYIKADQSHFWGHYTP